MSSFMRSFMFYHSCQPSLSHQTQKVLSLKIFLNMANM